MTHSFTLPFLLSLIMISAYVMANVVPGRNATLEAIPHNQTSTHPASLKNGPGNRPVLRVRRGCDCTTSGGRCMSNGDHQCWFDGKASMVVCNRDHWETVGVCPGSCKSLSNDQAYCI